jgi:hypothetical protein
MPEFASSRATPLIIGILKEDEELILKEIKSTQMFMPAVTTQM